MYSQTVNSILNQSETTGNETSPEYQESFENIKGEDYPYIQREYMNFEGGLTSGIEDSETDEFSEKLKSLKTEVYEAEPGYESESFNSNQNGIDDSYYQPNEQQTNKNFVFQETGMTHDEPEISEEDLYSHLSFRENENSYDMETPFTKDVEYTNDARDEFVNSQNIYETDPLSSDEFDEHEFAEETMLNDYQHFLSDVNYLVKDWTKAILLNRQYAKSLGWHEYFDKINELILPHSGFSNVSLGDEAFAQAVANWQISQGLSSKDSDGIIGPKTWSLMKSLILKGSVTPVSSGIPSTADDARLNSELNSNPALKAKYQTIQSYKPVRAVVSSWGISNPASYIESSLNEWNANTSVHIHFDRNFDGDPHRSYLNLRRLYQARDIRDPAGYFALNIVPITFFNRNTPGHKDLKAALNTAQNALISSGSNYTLSSAWSFVPRTFNENINKLSNHALGKAIDINPSGNPHILSSDDILVINTVCKSIIPGGLLSESAPDTLSRASVYFQSNFNDAWINLQPQNIKDAVKRRRSTLNKYASNGFMTLPVKLVSALQNAGLNWGGIWRSAKDFMHFELSNP